MELKRKAFLIIEVLISIVIIFMIIIVVTLSYKQLFAYNKKSKFYEELYITVKSVVNFLDYLDFNGFSNKKFVLFKKLNINGYDVNIFLKLVDKNNNLFKTFSDASANVTFVKGNIVYYLYKVKLIVKKENVKYVYLFHITKSKKLNKSIEVEKKFYIN
jgi:hypothetical protein